MLELLVATRNRRKLKEIKELLQDLDFTITSLDDYPDMPIIEEDGQTFEQNAIKKATSIALYTKKLVLGEDSGLEVKALHKEPGVYSSRFAGEDATDEQNNAKLLRCLKKIPLKKREACYRCVAVLADGKRILAVVGGSCQGLIALKAKGHHGFGYDPLFFIPRYQKTFGELSPTIKAKISHRARALTKIKKSLKRYLQSLAK